MECYSGLHFPMASHAHLVSLCQMKQGHACNNILTIFASLHPVPRANYTFINVQTTKETTLSGYSKIAGQIETASPQMDLTKRNVHIKLVSAVAT